MKILTSQQMRSLDRDNITHLDTCSIDLMEQASSVLCGCLCSEYDTGTQFVVFAGPGNNGGDGLAISRILANRKYKVEVFLFNTKGTLSPDCQINKERLLNTNGVVFHEITTKFDLPVLKEDVVIVDALFGTGLNRPLSGGFRLLAEFINKSNQKVISVDMPSGMIDVDTDCDSDADITIVHADETFTFHCVKPCMLLADNQKYLGRLNVLDIGLDDSNVNYSNLTYSSTDLVDARSILKPRNSFGHKGMFGHGLLIAGSRGMAGACVLAAKAALRSGIGKVSVHCPQCNLRILQICVPECVVTVSDDSDSVSTVNLSDAHYDAVAFGSGVGQRDDAMTALLDILNQCPNHLVIDADGLNLLSQIDDWQSLLPENTVLTPHRKELLRLCGGKDMSDTALLQVARQCAQECHIYIVLKGHYSMVVTPQGRVFFNVGGNSGMATAGSGDALTGIILALLAQGYKEENACRLGVWLHAAAGDFAARSLSEESLTASDIISNLHSAFRLLHSS